MSTAAAEPSAPSKNVQVDDGRMESQFFARLETLASSCFCCFALVMSCSIL